MAFQKAQVYADPVDSGVPGHIQHTVQQPAPLRAGDGHIEIAELADRVFGEQGVAMVAVGVDRIAAVGEVAPHTVCEEFVLGRLGPVVVA
ncbi:hypothetical protein D3C76_807890 [compost metagenome]